ncbi:MAG TPA: archease [Pseudothermotoga sp.]|nr:archease [Pseudothermotoga sp.]HPP69785.1 archease [Pseudothermotoga sp.]
MYRELDHTADLRYELICDDLQSLFDDLIKILKDNYKPVLSSKIVLRKEYPMKEIEDMVFDTVNDWIYMIDAQRLFPCDCKIDGSLRSDFATIFELHGTELKALTYHELKVVQKEGKIMLKVVFDT